MPPSASAKKPCRAWSAPEKAPFSWPKSSLSARFSGMALMLSARYGPLARPERPWMVRASTSLPVPLSPSMSTGTSDGAMRSAMETISFIAWLLPTIPWMEKVPESCALSVRFSRRSAPCSAARCTITSSSSGSKGFLR